MQYGTEIFEKVECLIKTVKRYFLEKIECLARTYKSFCLSGKLQKITMYI